VNKFHGKPLLITVHASERFLKRKIPENGIIKMLRKGVHTDDPNYESRRLRFYKESDDA